MVRFSNSIFAILNFATYVLSIPILGAAIWLLNRGDIICQKFLQWPFLGFGFFLIIFSLAGSVGSRWMVTWLRWLYLFVMFTLILLIFCFTVFAFVVTNKGPGKAVSNRGFKEYRVEDYSNWLQKRVEQSGNWRKIKSCLRDSKVCKSLTDDSVHELAEQFSRKTFYPIQSGCCTPPTACSFTYVNATYWTGSATSTNASDRDCATWSNEQDKLCYDCASCKAGVLANVKYSWRRVAIVNIVVLIALVGVYSVGCRAFRNNQREERCGYKGYA